jgi:hypothetical protein
MWSTQASCNRMFDDPEDWTLANLVLVLSLYHSRLSRERLRGGAGAGSRGVDLRRGRVEDFVEEKY